MRSIEITTEVFAMIRSQRRPGEEAESDILLRILRDIEVPQEHSLCSTPSPPESPLNLMRLSADNKLMHASWWEVVDQCLLNIGGEGNLSELYREFRSVCTQLGRPIPQEWEATIRGTLEDNSSDSHRWKKVRDVFCMPRGKHVGYWARRQNMK